jgi:D-alanyl-D-alanine carboxypeptidase
MAKKKVYKLKKSVKVIGVFLVLFIFLACFGYQKYEEYLYTQTYEYKFSELGYTEDEIKIFKNKLSNSELDQILSYEYNEFISQFVNCKYFLFKNLDGYLSQVITQSDDFFKYHGTDGYDYDNIVALTNVSAIYSAYENTVETDIDKNYSMLVNKYHSLSSTYEPDDLVSIEWKYRLGGATDYKYIRSEVNDAYVEMWEAAYQDGIYLLVDSGYRAYDKQESVYNEYQTNKGTKYADSIAARPGYSEHQTGLALDIYSKECTSASTFKDSNTYAWLMENAYKYGFILRYPSGSSSLTGYNYESWHYRYLGKELALKVHNEGITYDEYYAFYLDN